MSSSREFPIGDYGLIGDTRTAALVAPDGSIDWMCLPRFDSPPVFGRLVGGIDAGYFVVGPEEPAALVDSSYRGGTATLQRTWAVDGGRLALADSMVGEVAGTSLPDHMLVRRIMSQGRPIRVRVQISPRFGYDRSLPRRVRRSHGSVIVEHGDLALAVSSDADTQLMLDRPTTIEVTPGRPLTVVMSAAHRGPLFLVPPSIAAREAGQDESRWQQWADSLNTGSNHRRMMVRSLITLQLLTYSPSGAPVAAPTTSLPEEFGGSRNWDYRYAWPRDASMGINAFLAAGKDREALEFLGWLLHASRLDRPWLTSMFTLDGRPVPQERTVDWPGYAESRPVRVGNDARTQHQLDGYGWVLDAAWRLTRTGCRLDGETWRTMRAFADHVIRIVMQPDAGIWERRDQPRHHVHSKLMAWLALDRATQIARHRGADTQRVARWQETSEALVEEIRDHGFDPAVASYTAAYGSNELDAALLLLPWTGFEPEGSPRTIGTIEAVRRQLAADGPLLYRYRDRDGLTGGEGAFLPCSFWLVHALVKTGQRREAERLFEELLDLSSELGLYGEEMDPSSHQHLGNFPQALTHSALLQAAYAIRG